jgi:nucleotide-binding universal stress UspA family protein
MEIKRILWPTDFSSRAEGALAQVISLAEKYQAEVHVLFVIEDLAHHAEWYGAFEEARAQKVSDFSMRTAQEKLHRICEKYLEGCPLYIRHVAMGDPAMEILKLIEAEKMDLVVMASRGAKGEFPFGSVAEKIVRNAPVPVMTVPVGPEG